MNLRNVGLLVVVLFFSQYLTTDAQITELHTVKTKSQLRHEILSLKEEQLRSTSKFIYITAPSGVTLVNFANIKTMTYYTLAKKCTFLELRCIEWKEALRTLVVDNKETMYGHYLGCKLGYHAVTQVPVDQEVPDEVLIECYGNTILNEGTVVLLSKKVFFEYLR